MNKQKRLAEETLNKYFSVQSEEQLLDAYEKIIQEDPIALNNLNNYLENNGFDSLDDYLQIDMSYTKKPHSIPKPIKYIAAAALLGTTLVSGCIGGSSMEDTLRENGIHEDLIEPIKNGTDNLDDLSVYKDFSMNYEKFPHKDKLIDSQMIQDGLTPQEASYLDNFLENTTTKTLDFIGSINEPMTKDSFQTIQYIDSYEQPVPLEFYEKLYPLYKNGLTQNDKSFIDEVLINEGLDSPRPSKKINTNPYIFSKDYHKDGDISSQELNNILDDDNDGLTNEEEYKYGTSPNNPDTDKDGFSDLMETTDFIYNNKKYNFTGILDPLHKDFLVNMIYENSDGYKLNEDILNYVEEKFSEIPVSNPDGEQGINLRFFELDETPIGFAKTKFDYYDWDHTALGRAPGNESKYNLKFLKRFYNNDNKKDIAVTFMHEFGHNVFGELPEKIQISDDPFHCKYDDCVMYPSVSSSIKYCNELIDEIEENGYFVINQSIWNSISRSQ